MNTESMFRHVANTIRTMVATKESFHAHHNEIHEMLRCVNDPVHFVSTYVKIQHPTKGTTSFVPTFYQNDMFLACRDRKNVIASTSRQTGKTSTAAAFILWDAIFNFNHTTLIVSHTHASANDVMDRIRFMYVNLPEWLKPKLVRNNKTEIILDNNCKIFTQAASEYAGRGLTLSMVYFDEFAFINPRYQKEMMTSLIPALGPDGKRIVFSTLRDEYQANTFHELWDYAWEHTDEWFPISVVGK